MRQRDEESDRQSVYLKMKLRFKLRTLLIVTALVASFLGLQGHVHSKAKRFVDEKNQSVSQNILQFERATLAQVSLADVLLIKRRCRVSVGEPFNDIFRTFRVGILGKPIKSGPLQWRSKDGSFSAN